METETFAVSAACARIRVCGGSSVPMETETLPLVRADAEQLRQVCGGSSVPMETETHAAQRPRQGAGKCGGSSVPMETETFVASCASPSLVRGGVEAARCRWKLRQVRAEQVHQGARCGGSSVPMETETAAPRRTEWKVLLRVEAARCRWKLRRLKYIICQDFDRNVWRQLGADGN